MSDEEHEPTDEPADEPTNLPQTDARINLRGYHLMLRFHPEIKLGVKRGHKFANSLADYVPFEKNEYESHKWVFTEALAGEPSSKFVVTITPDSITLDVRSPSQKQEWVEGRIEVALKKFVEEFKPSLVLFSRVIIRALYPVDGDARTCLATHVMRMHPQKTNPFGRPIHVVGVRFFFPPFRHRGPDGQEMTEEWTVDVKAESYMEDPSQLFLEARAEWFEAGAWNDEFTVKVLGHLSTAKEYLENNVVGFLKATPEGDEPSEDEEGDE